jgi:hypothetical protein
MEILDIAAVVTRWLADLCLLYALFFAINHFFFKKRRKSK